MIQHFLSLLWLLVSQQGAAAFFLGPNAGAKAATNIQKQFRRTNSLFAAAAESSADDEDKEDMQFFMEEQDKSLQKLEKVADIFQNEPNGIMMEEFRGVVPTMKNRQRIRTDHITETNPIASHDFKTIDTRGVGRQHNKHNYYFE